MELITEHSTKEPRLHLYIVYLFIYLFIYLFVCLFVYSNLVTQMIKIQ